APAPAADEQVGPSAPARLPRMGRALWGRPGRKELRPTNHAPRRVSTQHPRLGPTNGNAPGTSSGGVVVSTHHRLRLRAPPPKASQQAVFLITSAQEPGKAGRAGATARLPPTARSPWSAPRGRRPDRRRTRPPCRG